MVGRRLPAPLRRSRSAGGGHLSDPNGDVARESAILGWTSPTNGVVNVEERLFRSDDPCDEPTLPIHFSVELAGSPLATISLAIGDSRPFHVKRTVAIGESIFFIVDPGSADACLVTLIRFEITEVTS